MFFSKTTNSFYTQEIHGDIMPLDVVSVSAEQYQEIQRGLSEGGHLSADAKGNPVVTPMAGPTESEIQMAANARHRRFLQETDWYVVRFTETGAPIPGEIKQARAEARAQIIE